MARTPEAQHKYYLANKEKIIARSTKWQEEHRERKREIERIWKLKNKDRNHQLQMKWRNRNKQKRRAHRMVETAVANGTIVKLACQICGSNHTHAHHDDYAFPLKVIWLCPQHHKDRHKELLNDQNG